MNVLWPGFLLLLALLPLSVVAYIWVLRRRRKYAVRFSSLALVRAALPKHSWLRRHLPFALLLLALSSLIAAASRPVAVVQVPSGQATIILALDVSRSMCSTDIPPSRLDAAQAAALSFIERQAPNTQVGVVAFAGFSALVQAPTTDQALLTDAVQGLTPARATAIGSGIVESLNAIAEVNDSIEPVTSDSLRAALSGEDAALPEPDAAKAYAPEIIVLLTDGVTTTGIPPLLAAQQAALRGIRVYTIGFGTADGGSGSICGGWRGQGFGFGGGGGGGFRRGIDEATLIQVSDMTGGDYYSAESAGELQQVFQDLPASFSTRPETTEISYIFAALGALLAAAAMFLALRWQPAL
jgi:Ca-activated chloride channel family protein